ncbi:MAG: O-antigen ligase family protein [Alphaproteobacteria bacterium]|nr:O-antigen ligase family protein [Alphaproteobacteria bacterium]
MLRFAELALATFAIVILTGSNVYYFMLGVPAGITAEELLAYEGKIRNIFLIAYVIVALLAVLNWQKMILGIAAVWPIALLVIFAWLSNLWTVAPEITSRRCVALTVTTLMGIYLFVRFDLETLLRFLTFIAAILVVGCLTWVALVPGYGLHGEGEHAGVWRGIFFHKNTTGRVMVYCLAIIIAAWAGGVTNRAVLFGIGLLTLLMIAGTTSQTTLLGLLALLGGLVAVRMVRGHAIKSALVTLVVLAIAWHGALIAASSYDLILEALGRDPSLTGRTDIWLYTLQYALKQPFTGYGYDAFWNGEVSPGAQYAAYWKTPHSHNGWLEVFIAFGLPGVLLMLGIMLMTVTRAIILARYHPTTTPAILIVLVCFAMLTIGMSEPVFLEKHSFDWMLLVAIVGAARALTSSLGSKSEQTEEAADSGLPQRRLPAGALRSYPT